MWKWISFILVLILAAWFSWYFGILQSVGSAFDDWLRWIGARK